MKELGITKGEWVHNPRNGVHTPKGNCIALSHSQDEEKRFNDAKLIADAGTTANKCGMLPSELLQRYNEAIEVLQKGAKIIRHLIEQETLSGESIIALEFLDEYEQTISKANRE